MKESSNLRDLTILLFKNLPKDVSTEQLMQTVVLADKILKEQKNLISSEMINTEKLLKKTKNWKNNFENE